MFKSLKRPRPGPQLLALPSPLASSEPGRYNIPGPYAAVHLLNDDILLNTFNFYRLDEDNGWNLRLGWCKLSQVCQRWRHLIYECAFYLGMHIECTNGTPIVDTLDHLPPLPLFVTYGNWHGAALTKQDELGIFHVLHLHDRVRHIRIKLPSDSSILYKVLVLLDEHFPILEHLSLSFAAENRIPLTLPKAFLAPNLRYLSLPGISPPRRLRLLTYTVSLITLHLRNIQASSYFCPKLLVARLWCLPQLENLHIEFAVPIPRPRAERELLGEHGAPMILPSLKTLQFKGVSSYLESLVTQIRAPLLKWLCLEFFNQIDFVLPQLSHLIDTTEVFNLSEAMIYFGTTEVSITMARHCSLWFSPAPLLLRVMRMQLDWQIDCAAQICNALTPALSGVEVITLECHHFKIPPAFQNGAIDSTMWHELLRPFIGVKVLHVAGVLLEELSRALQVGDIGSDPEFLPILQHIFAIDNLFTAFIDTRQVVGRPVQFSRGDSRGHGSV